MSLCMRKPTKWPVHRRLRSAWASTQSNQEFSLSAWRKPGSLPTHWAPAKTLIRLGGCWGWSESLLDAQVILLVLSWDGLTILSICPSGSQFDITVYLVLPNNDSEGHMSHMSKGTLASCTEGPEIWLFVWSFFCFPVDCMSRGSGQIVHLSNKYPFQFHI